ncbi:MAG: hypothetical protein J5669_03150 [Bacteroidales bacterium]|nr:hypothetical protein [Bacteroidales bacterium]
MKNTLIAGCLAALISFSAFAQEKVSNKPDFAVIGRVDANLEFPQEGCTFNWGNTGLYTQLSGNIGSLFSYLLLTHWVNSDPRSLYESLGRNDSSSCLDFAYIRYDNQGWGIELGKDFIPYGTFEMDGDDYSAHPIISTSFWNSASLYQWGLKLSYTLPSQLSTFTLGASASPFSGRPFLNGLFAYSFQWRGEFGPFANIWSANIFEMPGKRYVSSIALGNKLSFGPLTFSFDLVNTAALDVAGFFNQELTLGGCLTYQICDLFELQAKAGWERNNGPEPFILADVIPFQPYCFGGAAVHYFPIRDNHDLRLHLTLAWNNYLKGPIASIGVLYSLGL